MSNRGGHEAGTPPAGSLVVRLAPWAVMPVPLLVVAIAALWLLDGQGSYESRGLLALLNFTLVTCVSAVIALLAARTFVATGLPGTLFLGSGVLVMGAAFAVAPLSGRGGPNFTATVHNVGMLAAGGLSLLGAWMSYRPRAPVRAPRPVIVAAYASALAFVAATAYLARVGASPPFFVQGTGGTPLRQAVLASGVGAFGVAGILLLLAEGNATLFRRWFGLGLVLIGVGLLGVMLQEALGSPISWVGRFSQYLGSVYLLVASVTSATEARRWSLPLEAELRLERDQTRQLRQAKEKLARVLEGSNDGYWEFDIAKNQASLSERWAEITGYPFAEIEQHPSTWDRLTHPEDRERSWALLSRYIAGEVDQHVVEARLRHRDGHWVWVLIRGKIVERDADGKPTRLAGTCTDISARKRAEELLRETKERLSLVIDASGDGFMDWEVQTGRVKFSRRGAELLGYDLDELRPEAATWKGLVHPEDEDRIMAALEAHLRGETDHYECEHRARHKGGRWIWVLGRGRVVSRDEHGKPLRMIGTYTDISRLKEAEVGLLESRETALRAATELQALLDAVPAAIYITHDAGATTMTTNRFGADLMKVAVGANVSKSAPEDQLPRSFKAMKNGLEVSPEDLPVQVAAAQGVEVRNYEFDIVTEDGAERHLLGNASPIRDEAGRPAGAVGAFVDVTALQEATRKVQRSEQAHRRFREMLPVAAFVDREGRIEEPNLAALKLLGATRPEQVLGKGKADFMSQAGVDVGREQVARALAGQEPLSKELDIHGLDGVHRIAQAFGTLFEDERGKAVHVVLADVTEQKSLQRQVEVATRLAALGTLVAGLAHEINNPLAAEMAGQGFALEVARAARQQLETGMPIDAAANIRELDDVIEALEDAQEAGRRVAKIIRELAAFARPDPARSLVRLRDVVEQGVRWLPALPPDGTRVEVDDQGAPDVLGAAGQLAQVVHNLVTNALKAAHPGAPGTVTVRLGTDERGQATLEVIDRGVGMAPEIRGRVFEPFFTTRPTGEGRGTGLGLSVCHSIVAAHGGTITVASEAGKGSTFTVKLPPAPPES